MTVSSKHLSEQELSSQLNQANGIVEVGAVYIHTRSQNRYRVINLAVMEASQEIAVVYQKEGDLSSPLWVRVLSSWTETQEIEGSLTARFQKVKS